LLTYRILQDKKKWGVVTNQSGILSNKTHLVDFTFQKYNCSKSHGTRVIGFRKILDAGEHIVDGTDSKNRTAPLFQFLRQ
jgi:hypothetical protein